MAATASAMETIENATLTISDIHCLHCAACLEETIADVAGVAGVTIDAATGAMRIRYRSAILRLADLIEAMQSLGLRAS